MTYGAGTFRGSSLALVWAGGTAGTAARYSIGRVAPHLFGVPVATMGINVLGAFLLGLLLETLSRRDPATVSPSARLLLGTGFLGGFTTYSALAVDTVTVLGHGQVGSALSYAFGTLLMGAVAGWAGIGIGVRRAGGTERTS